MNDPTKFLPAHVIRNIEDAEYRRRIETERLMLISRALIHGVCPGCGGSIKERRSGFLFTKRVGYDCTACGAFHVSELE